MGDRRGAVGPVADRVISITDVADGADILVGQPVQRVIAPLIGSASAIDVRRREAAPAFNFHRHRGCYGWRVEFNLQDRRFLPKASNPTPYPVNTLFTRSLAAGQS